MPVKILPKLIAFSIFVLLQNYSLGQFYDIGQEPAKTRWGKIESGNFSIIYPDYYYLKARDIALKFRLAEKPVASGMNTRVRHTPLILHPLFPVSNAYAIWAPRRIEILTIPPQDMYAQPWIQQLALHEYRHIAQLSSLNQGFTGFLGYLFGQQAAAAVTGLFVPSWFIEGDAVATETALSKSGRGRVPSFSQTLRAQLSDKGAYSYPKASFGSYRDFVPDIYTLGYHIVATSRMKYGTQLWPETMKMVACQPWTITPFNRGIKKKTGLNKKGIYRESMRTLDSLWVDKASPEGHQFKPARTHEGYTNYIHPYRINDSTIIALKKSFSDILQIVSIGNSGKEKIIFTPGYLPDERISYSGGLLAWAEYKPHVRWETVGFTSIVVFDPQSKKAIRNAYKGRLFSPVKSPINSDIAAIEYKPDGTCYLTLIGPETMVNHRLPEGIHGATPCWSPDGRYIVIIATGNDGKALARIEVVTGAIEYLTGYSYTEMSNPFFSGSRIYYTGTVAGKNQIVCYDEKTRLTYVISDSRFGADYVSVRGDSLYYSVYTADGFRIAKMSVNGFKENSTPVNTAREWPLAEAISAQEKRVNFSQSLPDNEFEHHDYKKVAHLFGMHSWAPVFVDIGGESVRPGISVMSQNLLSTLFISAGYDYNIVEEAGMFRADVTWKGWFPVLKATFSDGLRASSQVVTEGHSPQRFTWNETNLDFKISQNLNFAKGAYNSVIYGETGFNLTSVKHNNSTPSGFLEGELSGLAYRAIAYSYRRQAYRDLGPRNGYYIDAEFRHTPFGQIRAGNIFGSQIQVFIPGLMKNHSVLVYLGIQKSNPESYRFSNIISTGRGYTSEISGNNLFSIKASYRMPLIYPDIHLGGLLFIKRIRTSIFHDLTGASDPEPRQIFNSSGLDLVADVHLFGLSTPVSLGMRTVYLESNGNLVAEFLFSVNFYDY